MLWDIFKDKEITTIPHKKEYDLWLSRLTQSEIDEIKNEILKRFDGDEIATAGWIPGADWNGTPFETIFYKACRLDQESSAKCFGLIVWDTMLEHEDYWAFGRYEVKNVPIQSMTYFKVHPKS